MATKVNPDTVTADAARIVTVWKENTDFKMKDVTLAELETNTQQLDTLLKDIAAKEAALTPLRNQRDDLALKINGVCTRARAGIKGFYGPNSTQYEQAGGTRASERKRPKRKTNPSA